MLRLPPSIPLVMRELHDLRSVMGDAFRCATAFGSCIDGVPSAGHCLLASIAVQELYGGEIRTSIVEGIPHYWNRLDYERGLGDLEVDLTADQFGREPVLIRRRIKEQSARFRRERHGPLPDKNPEATRLYRAFLFNLLDSCDRHGFEKQANILKMGWVPSEGKR
jgi:hypothetical protein